MNIALHFLMLLVFSCASQVQEPKILKLELVKNTKIGENQAVILKRYGKPKKVINVDKFFNVKNIDNWQYFEKDNKRLSFSINRKTGTVEGYYWHFLPTENISLIEIKKLFPEFSFQKKIFPGVPHGRPKEIKFIGKLGKMTVSIKYDEYHHRVSKISWY